MPICVVIRAANPEVNIAGGAGKPMRGEGERANEQELNAFLAQYGQHVAEVGVQQRAPP